MIPSWHLLFKHWPGYVPFREFLCFLVVESWSRGVVESERKTLPDDAGVVHCRRNAREASRGASSRGTPAPCLQALGIKVDGQVPCSHLSLHILAHLGTHFAPLPSPLHWTLHCIVYFQSVLNASVIHPTQSYAHLHVVTCRSTLKHLFVGAVQKFFISCYTSADSS